MLEGLGATLARAGVFLVLCGLVFVPAERLWGARTQPIRRAGLGTDLAHALFDPLLVNAIAALLLAGLAAALHALVPSSIPAAVHRLPLAGQIAVALVLGEVAAYWAHRAFHAVPALWRMHAVHHSSESLDWLSAHRQHAVEQAVLLAITNLPALVMDVRLSTFVVLVLLQKVHTVLVHSNVRLPLGPFRRLVGGPEFHRVHHTTGGDRSNYASLLPVLDWIFGTYAEDGRGLCGTAERVSRSWWGQLWLRRR